MSTKPGPRLEDFVAWWLDLRVPDYDSNPSLAMAEAMGVKTCRVDVTEERLSDIAALFEGHRDQTELCLSWFDEDAMSWDDYGGTYFDFIPEALWEQAREMIAQPRKAAS